MKTKDLSVTYDGRSYIGFDFQSLPLEVEVAVGAQQVDQAADAARVAMLGDNSRFVEYSIATGEARAYADAGYEGDVPASVTASMASTELSAKEAADEILAAAQAFHIAITGVRSIRLKAKKAISDAYDHDGVEAITDQAVAHIQACISGVGNAV
ncbi:hypothetical protein [Pseudomonas hunanensis]|uniref:hypothetical protein n=1 Tax=Pseudomonas hunanensis TaxID=1247546 RepID=UPI000CA685D6|nr:hypothetical protein [Pseudomonas hunanensis]PKF27422.1 hypothetical protein CW309_05550 [Pseudomonas hunanensis]